jgi:type IV secretion system protein VirD4
MNKFLLKFAALLVAGLVAAYFIFAESINAWLLELGQTALRWGGILVIGALVLLVLKLKQQGGGKSLVGKLKGGTKSSGSHGSADFATTPELKKAGLLAEKGFIIGRHANGKFVRFSKPGHLITFAPTRSGKGIGHVIPNLLDHPGSVIVNDIKGENYAVSGQYRKKFTDVYTFAPFNDDSNCYNPLDFIRIGTEYELDDVSLIADMVVVVNQDAKDPFWDRESQNIVKCLILHVATSAPPALRNMAEVRYMLMQNKKDFEYSIKEMCKSKNPHVKKMASALSATEPKVMASLLSVARSQTAVWDSPKLQKITSRSDFDPIDFKRKPTSFYLIIPPEYLDVYKSVVRLLTGITLASMLRTKGKPEHPCLFLIDEFPALGYMQNIETGVGYLAGYGVSVWLFIQDLAQLKANYPKWESLIANCSVRVAFGTNDFETAKVLSDMLGTTTITVKSGGQTREGDKLLFRKETGISTNTSETSRQLMTPDEVMRIPFEEMLVFVQGLKPILAKKVMYFKDPEFKGKFGSWEG